MYRKAMRRAPLTANVPECLCFPFIASSAMHAARIVAASRMRSSQYFGGYWLIAWISAALGAILVCVMVFLLCCKNRPVGSDKPRKKSTADDEEPNLEPMKDFGATPSPWAAGSYAGGLGSVTDATRGIIPAFDPLQKFGSCRAAHQAPEAFDPLKKFGSCRVNNLLYDADCNNSDDGSSAQQGKGYNRRQDTCAEDGLSC